MDGDLKAIILTEGGSHVGLGHLTRCASLYQAFEEKGISPEFVVNGDSTAEEFIRGNRGAVYNWLQDERRLFSSLEGADFAVVDSYLADLGCYEKISERAGVPLYLDDNKRLEYPAGVIVNGSINAKVLDYPSLAGCEYLLGPMYIPLRKEFRHVPDKRIGEIPENIMVTMGGDDIRNITPGVLKLLNEEYPELGKKVVIGKGFRGRAEMESMKDEKTELVVHPDAEGMKRVMLESDIAVSAGGQTLYELARIGVPTIAVIAADNQRNNVQGGAEENFLISAGWWNSDGLLGNIKKGIALLESREEREWRAKAGRSLVDGLGAVRIAGYCIKRHLEKNTTLRAAEPGDVNSVYMLSNDREVRLNSFNQGSIAFQEHKSWFARKLKDANSLFLVAESEGDFIGQVRFDISGGEATVSISIHKKFRGLGIGTYILQRALSYLESGRQDVTKVNAYVKEGNPSSSRVFEKAGFMCAGEVMREKQKALHYACYLKET